MKSYLRSLILFLFITFSFGLNAQLNYKNGYIITLNNDTLFGRINDGGDLLNSKFCLFKPEKKGKTTKYYPGDIKSYRFTDGKYYSAMEVFRKGEFIKIFTDVLLEGEISLYYDRRNKDMAYYLERKGENPIGLQNEYIAMRGQSQVGHIYYGSYINGVVINVYKDTLLSVFSDSKKIQNQVQNVDYGQKPLINITKTYLNETCRGVDCIRYEKDLNASRESFGIYTGIQFSNITFWESTIKEEFSPTVVRESSVKSDIFMNVPLGLFYNIPLKLINDRLSFQFELLTNSLNYPAGSVRLANPDTAIKVNSRYVGIPLLLKYEIAGRKISPSVSFGKETSIIIDSRERLIHTFPKGGWFGEVGLNYKLGPKFSLFTNLRVQSNYTLMIPEDGNANRLTYKTAIENKAFDQRFKTNFAALYFGMKF